MRFANGTNVTLNVVYFLIKCTEYSQHQPVNRPLVERGTREREKPFPFPFLAVLFPQTESLFTGYHNICTKHDTVTGVCMFDEGGEQGYTNLPIRYDLLTKFRPESEIRAKIYKLQVKSKIRAQKIDESAIRCNCRIRKSVKMSL